MKTVIRGSRFVAVIVFTLFLGSCLPCGCKLEKLAAAFLPFLGPPAPTSFTMTFDSPFFGADRFTATATFAGPPPSTQSASGTYSKSGDTITFTFDPPTGALGIPNGKYTITCDGKNMSLKGPGFARPIVFNCAD